MIRILQTYKAVIKFQEERVLEIDWENLEKTRSQIQQKNLQLTEWIKKLEKTYLKLNPHFKEYVKFYPDVDFEKS